MDVNGKHFRTIWVNENDNNKISIIDQLKLPHEFAVKDLCCLDDAAGAIKNMNVRGAGLIGAAAGYGMYLAALEAPSDGGFDNFMKCAGDKLIATRPTAVNLSWAVQRQLAALEKESSLESKIKASLKTADEIADEDADHCRRIGEHGVRLIAEISTRKKGKPVNILTHCNAGWLAFVDYGSATSPVYSAYAGGIDVHVYVDETRPRNQGAALTAWELGQQGVKHTVITDNAGGHLMQHGLVDIVIVGTDRTTYTGDVANKIGTYLKALAARDNNVPFYVALPSSTFDWEIRNGVKEISIEERDPDEIRYIQGSCEGGIKKVLITPDKSPAANYSFDVTPARLISGLITERGICEASEKGILDLFSEHRKL